MKKLILFILYLAITLPSTLYPVPSQAQESSQSGSITDKINALKTEIASRAAQLKSEMTRKVQNKAIMGEIENISSNEITIKTLTESKTVRYDEFTEARGLKNKEIKVDTLERGDKIAALGDVDDKNTLIAQRLVFLERFASGSAELVWGQIQKTQGSTITLKTKSGQTENVVTTSQTNFFLGTNEASINDAKVEKHLLIRATRQKNNTLVARFIYFIPSMGFLKPDTSNSLIKTSSPSATRSPEPTVTP